MAHTVLRTFLNLLDGVRGDKEGFIDEESFEIKLNELVDNGFIIAGPLDDITVYQAKNGLKWADFVHIQDPIKKSILLELVENPSTFFVLLNTQKGKMRIASQEIKNWGQDNTKKVVSFIIVDNDKTLSDQSIDGIKNVFSNQKVKIFSLSSTSKTSYDEIKTYIDAYSHGIIENNGELEYPMPIIFGLGNSKQAEKILKLINHIDKKASTNNSSLRYGIIWDEADRTYKQLRDKPFIIDGENMSYKKFMAEKTEALYRLGFVSATEGDLLLDEEYPECANAYLYPVIISQEDQENYRALHHPESVSHKIPFVKDTCNSYAEKVIETNLEHFMTPINLANGERYYRKTIVNSNAKTDEMNQFAKWCNKKGMHALIFNGYGGISIKILKVGQPTQIIRMKGRRLNEVIYYIYKKLNLNDKPLVIIGKRKVDRGLGFHYCPRNNDKIEIDGDRGILTTENRDGIVFTDMILGYIENNATAVQKAGRLAGIIGNSPQYPGSTHYWMDQRTEQLIRRHNTVIDETNNINGCSVFQAVKHAQNNIPLVIVDNSDPDPRASIPIVIKITEEVYKKIKKDAKGWDIKTIHFIIEEYSNDDTYDKIKNMKRIQVVCPEDDASYKKYITTFIDKSALKAKYKILQPMQKKDNLKNTDTYQIYLDKREFNIIVSIYYGITTSTLSTPSV